MNGTYLLLGSNLNDRLANLRVAVSLLQEAQIKVLNESSIYETEPWGIADQGWFLNVVLHIETQKKPQELLDTCLEIEAQMGRIRAEKWGVRLIDIDILYYSDETISNQQLSLPHPGIQDRRFTLMPLVELCPDEIHPTLKLNHRELLAKCADTLDCKPTEFLL